MDKQTTKKPQSLTPTAHLVLVGVSLGISYLAVSRAIDTGSLLEYTIALVMFVLAIKNLLQAFQRSKGN